MSTLCRCFGTTGLLALALVLGAGCNKEAAGGSKSDGHAAASNQSASALLVEAGDAKEGKNWKKALDRLDLVLADPKATVEERSLAWQDKVVCTGLLDGDAAASATIKKLEDSKFDLEAKYYFQMGNELKDADLLHAALDVITVATEKFKGDKLRKKQLRKFAKDLNAKLVAAGDTKGSDTLKGLGYLGGSDDDDEK
jgi:hypothetical protein